MITAGDEECPLVSLKDYQPLPKGDDQYTSQFMQSNEAVVLSLADEIVVGLVDPQKKTLRKQIQAYHRSRSPLKHVSVVMVDKSELYLFLGKKSREIDSLASKNGTDAPDDGVYLDKIANDAPVVNLVSSLILQAYNEGASDIHFDAQTDGFHVRFRVDGILRPVELVHKELQIAVSSRIKVMAQLNIMERRLPQDGRCSVQLAGTSCDIRVSILPSTHGESIVLRLLQKENNSNNLETLGYLPEDAQLLRALIGQPHGLLLSTGPTGSGKTTSLHALIRELPIQELKVITLEDPVEYQIRGITQVQINDAIGLSFEASLRRVLRQDPDVIMVGEIRDHATADLAIRAGLTGHFVLSSLHTNSSLDSLTRLSNMGVEPYLIAAVLRGVIGQRLVRKLCLACAQQQKTDENEKFFLQSLGLSIKQVYHPKGCEQCHNTGYSGRSLVYELLIPNKKFLEAVASSPQTITVQQCRDMTDFAPMSTQAERVLSQGITSVSELQRVLYA